MNQSLYEMLYIIDAGVDESQIQRIQNEVKETINSVGEVTKENVWGRRRLAYPIKKKTEGVYIDIEFKATHEVPNLIRELFHTRTSVLRHLCLKVPKAKLIQEKREADLQRRRQEAIEKERREQAEREERQAAAAAAAAAEAQAQELEGSAASETVTAAPTQPEVTATAPVETPAAPETAPSAPVSEPAPTASQSHSADEAKPPAGETPTS